MSERNVAVSLALITLLCLNILSFASVGSRPEAESKIIPLTTYHSINIDANLSDWQADEVLYGNDNTVWYLTWNSTRLFIALNRGETFHGSDSDYDVIWVYLDTRSGGTPESVDWNGRHVLAFNADWCFILRPWNKYWNLREWNGSAWVPDMPYFGVEPAQDWWNGIAEIEIPFEDIGSPESLSVSLFLTNGADNYLFGASPTANPSGYDVALKTYWIYPELEENVSPNSPLVASAPLHINGNSDFIYTAQTYGWPGNGSQENPYLIEGYLFDGNGGDYALWIENTDLHFIVRKCQFWNTSNQGITPYGDGILLSNVSNAIIENNILTQNVHGIHIINGGTDLKIIENCITNAYFGVFADGSAINIEISENIISNNNEGIVLYSSQNSKIRDNTILFNAIGITLGGTRNLEIEGNHIMRNYYHGIYIFSGSEHNLITQNIIAKNRNTGITIAGQSSGNCICYNTFSDNVGYAVAITENSNSNQVYGNNFYRNNGAGKGVNGPSQAYDDVGNAWDNGSAGNYWSNWDGTGTYPIDGSAHAEDRYPQTSPVVVEGHGLYVLIGLIFAVGLLRRAYL